MLRKFQNTPTEEGQVERKEVEGSRRELATKCYSFPQYYIEK